MRDLLLQRLHAEGLLKREFVEKLEADEAEADYELERGHTPPSGTPNPVTHRPPPPHLAVLRLCERGALDGGLSVALGVRPDELMGALCMAVGGSANRVRVVDVRDRPAFELRIRYGELEEAWALEDLYALVHNLNDLLREDPAARAIAVLGEWEDALQLWCVPKPRLQRLLRQDFFAPRNRHQLEAL